MSRTEEMRKLMKLYEDMSLTDVVADINASGVKNEKTPEIGDKFLMQISSDLYNGSITDINGDKITVVVTFTNHNTRGMHGKSDVLRNRNDTFTYSFEDFGGDHVTWDDARKAWIDHDQQSS